MPWVRETRGRQREIDAARVPMRKQEASPWVTELAIPPDRSMVALRGHPSATWGRGETALNALVHTGGPSLPCSGV